MTGTLLRRLGAAAAGRRRRAWPSTPTADAPRNCASASSRRPPASSPRSARTWSTASRCTSTRSRATSAGAKVKFIVEDEQAKPDTAVTKAKKLILQDKVHMLVGGVLASSGYALAPVSTDDKTVYIVSGPGGRRSDPARSCQYPYLIRTGWTSSQPQPSVRAMGLRQGYKKIVAIGADYAFGYEVGRRLPEGVRGLRRADHPEDLAAARHQGLRALHPDHQGGRRRDLHADGRADGAAVSEAAARGRHTRSRSSAAARATTSSSCRRWATR